VNEPVLIPRERIAGNGMIGGTIRSRGGFALGCPASKLNGFRFSDPRTRYVLASLLESAVSAPMELDEACNSKQRKVQPELGLKITERRGYWGEEGFHATFC